MNIDNKTIIVIGASGGIGSVLSREFVHAGANVILSARTESKLIEVAKRIGREKTLVVPADAASAIEMAGVFSKAHDTFGSVDAIVIAAGTWKQLSINEDLAEAIALEEYHHKALFQPTFVAGYTAQEFFREQGYGLIANISSHAAVKPELPGNLTYGPFKAASRHFMLALAHELKGTKVRVTDLEPAIVNTPDAATLLDTEEKREAAVKPEAIATWLIEHFDDPDIPQTKLFESTLVL